jgi:hypothetical protein
MSKGYNTPDCGARMLKLILIDLGRGIVRKEY